MVLGKFWIGNANWPMCTPGKSAFMIPGRTSKNTKIPSGTACLIDMDAVIHNLPQEISVNCYLVHPKGSVLLVIVVNQNNHSVLALATIIGSGNHLCGTSSMGLWGRVPSKRAEYGGGTSANANG